ncbi:N,N-dimethylformamidase beta subunit family domain-containing protein [Yinghuangia sp. YIM S10712]|uniref:N,N-dimethylformamidase beta subunit family domain-containing protein n=1 Tax=Yinghuangia sp. YIM S10712 TaxID=3436930 RepID=UPI003F53D908
MFALLGSLLTVIPTAGRAEAGPCDAPVVNAIICENSKTGTPRGTWDVSGSGSADIQGFATEISVNVGETVHFKVDTPATAYRLDIYRLGWYGGNGARKVITVNPSAPLPQNQPGCDADDATTGLVDCSNWAESASWNVPADAVSGYYLAKLVRTDGTSGASHIAFVVRDDASASDLLMQASDATWQAYNEYGGNSLYEGEPVGRAYKVSYNRPFTTRGDNPEDWLFNAEYPMLRFLERNGYDVTYTTNADTARRGQLLTNHEVFLSVGHDEYWSAEMRANVEAARDAGVHLAFFSGNEIFWKTRWENGGMSGEGAPYRTLVSYKETHDNDKTDPAGAGMWTGTWRDPRFSPPADGGKPENALTGQQFKANCCTTDMTVNSTDGQLRFWRNTRAATLAPGTETTLGSGLLGYEWDVDTENSARPANMIRLSTTTESGEMLQDFGSTYADGTATHHLTLYRAPSGALVFGAGTIQWPWGLDNTRTSGTGSVDTAVQQATLNLFADMGVQPGSLMPGMTAPTPSTDTTAPTSQITAPAAGQNIAVNQTVTVTGTAADSGGGRVGGVEVSVDNGATWKPATAGRESWTYTFTPTTPGPITLKSRATDDSLRSETPGAGVTVTAGEGGPPPEVTCPCTIWPEGTVPTSGPDPEVAIVELGVKFKPDRDGYITGVRYYKFAENTGTHVGHLWSASGTQLAEATFIGESTSGWQQVLFATPVAVTANTTYVASYLTTTGRYAADEHYFDAQFSRAPLTAVASDASGGNGVYRAGGGFPNATWNAANYWVDVVFTTTPPTTGPPPTDPPPPNPPTCSPCTIWPANTVPGTPSDPEALAIEVGVKFRTDVAGHITGVRFYKGDGNTGTHVAHLWTATGTLLATKTFTGETATGWQQATFDTPVAVTAGTTYVASYYTPTGHYAADQNGLVQQAGTGPVKALADAASGGNGVYRLGTGGGFPSATWSASNYWVDVTFTTG